MISNFINRNKCNQWCINLKCLKSHGKFSKRQKLINRKGKFCLYMMKGTTISIFHYSLLGGSVCLSQSWAICRTILSRDDSETFEALVLNLYSSIHGFAFRVGECFLHLPRYEAFKRVKSRGVPQKKMKI